MRIIKDPSDLTRIKRPLFLAAGFFDGLHNGHRRVIDAAISSAAKLNGGAWALTFDRHPRSVIMPESAPKLIMSTEMRLEYLAATGLDGTVLLNFTTELGAMTPEAFIGMICAGGGIAEIHCGENWHFGANATGNPQILRCLGGKYGFSVKVSEAATFEGLPVSSTRIRAAIARGDLKAASAMLGHSYTIRETVIKGGQIAGRHGLPTANFLPEAELMPPTGVYAVATTIEGRLLRGIANYGYKPTFGSRLAHPPILEAHFFDFTGDIYGMKLDISFVAFIRSERKFSSETELFAQARQDVEEAKMAFET